MSDYQLYPCYGGWHDFAVGDFAAICNRCEKVVPLSVPLGDEPSPAEVSQ